MTTVLSIDNLSTSAADVSVPQLNQANLHFVRTDAAQGKLTDVWQIQSGDASHRTYVRASIQEGQNGGNTNATISLSSWARKTVDGVDEYVVPISMAINFSMPPNEIESADLLTMAGNLFGLTFHTLTSKVPDTSVLEAFRFRSNKMPYGT